MHSGLYYKDSWSRVFLRDTETLEGTMNENEMDEMDENPTLRIIDQDDYNRMVSNLQDTISNAGAKIGFHQAERMVDDILRLAGAICPPPEPDPETCTALLGTTDGWWQCDQDPGHDGDHDGEWSWRDTDPNAIAPVKEN